MSERARPHGVLRVLGPVVLAVTSIGANTIVDSPVSARTNNPSSRPTGSELYPSNSLDSESIGENLARLNVTPEMQEAASQAFTEAYGELKSHYTFDAGDGALRLQYSQDPENLEAAIEYQTLGELMALYVGDFEYAEGLMRFDDIYKQSNELYPWKINKNGEPADYGTVVSDTMIRLAAARLMSPSAVRQTEGRALLQSMKDNELVDPKTKLFRAFDWDDQPNLANPAYPNPLFIEQFAKIDPEYAEVAEATRKWMGKIDALIESGKIVFFPSWVDLKGRVTDNEGEEAKITYYAPYVTLNQTLGALYCENPIARADATKQLSLANDFFYGKIARTDENGNIEYDSDRLVDGYLLNGKVDRSEDRYTKTAFTSAAALASIVSEDPAYREYMFNILLNLPHPAYEPFNDYVRTFALLALSGKMGQQIPEIQPTPTPEATMTPSITPEPTNKPEATGQITESEIKLRPGEVIEHGDRSKPEIFFTIDDGWDIGEMEQILDIAEKYKIKITLFPTGESVEANPEFYLRAHKLGHSIQNHSWDHSSGIDKFSPEDLRKQITDQRDAVRRALKDPNYVQHSFRPPEGVGAPPWYNIDKGMQKVLTELGYSFGMFTSVSEAWNGDTGREVERKLSQDIQNGSIIVLHDEKADIRAFPALIEKALAAGLKPVTMDEIFKDN